MKFHSGKDRIDDLASADADQDDEVYGDFEDLETGYGDLLRDFWLYVGHVEKAESGLGDGEEGEEEESENDEVEDKEEAIDDGDDIFAEAKRAIQDQAQKNKSAFIDDEPKTRAAFQGFQFFPLKL